jgi:hypothetical protein
MVCALPFRPRYSLAPRVFEIRTTQGLSTNPALVLSRTCTPPQWLALTIVAHLRKRGRPCLPTKAPRVIPRPFSMSKQENPFCHWALDPAFEKRCRAFRKSRPQGLATLTAASAFPAHESFSQLSTLMGFTLQGFAPAPRRVTGFPATFRPYAFPPNPSAWRRRSGGLRSRNQPYLPPPGCVSNRGEAVALLSFCTSRVFFRRTFEEAPAFFMPLPFFSSPPPRRRRSGTPGVSFRRRGVSLLAKGAHPLGVSDRPHPRILTNNACHGLFFQLGVPEHSRIPKFSSLWPTPPRLAGTRVPFRSHVLLRPSLTHRGEVREDGSRC